ncbi:emerin isoform X1 [Anguilla anguilla]|uniref:emerin isoform X1 n=1 Tax=Anguilla anguilla TaxID=7936 RepID=UPI0015B00407|nr:emerin isoform X1 [Anguilla anguilla]XP_035237566.1 emerin isoform X1 [Anguilla anguilla]XP_035237567.1 emerin isoform X1 [Anguilla anguilla]
MAALSSKSAQEISDLLDDYGIKHGPIVDSTRGLYEKKLKAAMAADTPAKPLSEKTYYREEEERPLKPLYEKKLKAAMAADSPAKPLSDKTYYREEEEEITYVHRRVPLRSELVMDSGRSYYTSAANYREPEDESGDQPSVYRSEASQRYVSQSEASRRYVSQSQPPLTRSALAAAPQKGSGSRSGRLIPLWLQFLVFLVVAAFLYYVFTSMEAPENNPFKGVE